MAKSALANPNHKLISVSELEIGDHIYVVNKGFDVAGFQGFCHHAIVTELPVGGKGGKVVGFGKPKKGAKVAEEITGEERETVIKEQAEEGEGAGGQEGLGQELAVKAAAVFIRVFFKGEVKEEQLESFYASNPGPDDAMGPMVCSYQYQNKDKVVTYLTGKSRSRVSSDKENAARVARVFSEHVKRQAFGIYDLELWNCEFFATFCRTTGLTAEDLKAEIDKLGEKGHLRRKNYMIANSSARSMQIERFKAGLGGLSKEGGQA